MLLVGLSGCAHDRAVRETNLQRQSTPLTASYLLEVGESPVRLVNGQAEVPAAPGSAAVVRTTVWGEPTMADLSGDGRDDAALILIQESAGSGTFYYLAIAVQDDDDFRGVASVFLGDRIVPQRIAVGDNRVTVHYLDRERGEAMSTPASHPRVRKFRYDSVAENLAVVAENS